MGSDTRHNHALSLILRIRVRIIAVAQSAVKDRYG
jgi:hypothetical protein